MELTGQLFERAYGIDYWTWLERNPERGETFNRLMQGGAQREAEMRVAESGFASRLSVVRGSFFDGVPAGADTYVLAKVLHDWDDGPAQTILTKVRAAAGDDARVLIIDAVVDEGDGDDDAKWTDLVMLALVGGRERTAEDWRALLANAGFRVVRIGDELIEAMPASG